MDNPTISITSVMEMKIVSKLDPKENGMINVVVKQSHMCVRRRQKLVRLKMVS